MLSILNARLRACIRRTREDQGFSLTELIVAMGLFSILAALIVTAFATFSTTFNRDRSATNNTNMAAVGMDELTRVIRAGTSIPVNNAPAELPVFYSASANSLEMNAYLDTNAATPAPVRVRFAVDPSTRELRETRWTAYANPVAPKYWLFNGTPSGNPKLVASQIVNPAVGEAPMFQYFMIDPATKLDKLMVIPSGGLTSAQLLQVVAVEITVKVQTDPSGRANPVSLVNRVGLPNLGISRLGL